MICGTSGFHSLFWGSHPTNTSKTQWLAEYSKSFKSVELSYIYKDLTPKICKKWIDAVGEDFKFTIVYKEHLKDLKEWWKTFEPCATALENNLECILFKFDSNFQKTKKNITKIKNIKKIIPGNIKCAFEFYDLEWFVPCKITEKLFTRQNWTQVILVSKSLRNLGTEGSKKINIGVKNPDFVYIKCLGTGNCETLFLRELYDICDYEKYPKCRFLIYFDSLIETWTLVPGDENELDVPCDANPVPSTIYNAAVMKALLSKGF
jgi:uncharacterized protein YecE (DUF72 family)